MATTFLQKPFSDFTSCIEDAQQFKCIYPAFPAVCYGFDSGNIDLRITETRLAVGGFYGAVDGPDRRPFYVVDIDPNNYDCSVQVIYKGQDFPEYLPYISYNSKFYNFSSCFRNINGRFFYITPMGTVTPWLNA